MKRAEDELDILMWDLLSAYEGDLKLLEPFDPASAVDGVDEYREPWVAAVIESAALTYEWSGVLLVRQQRQMPQTLTVNVNANLALPTGFDINQLPEGAQEALQAMLQTAQQATQAEAMEAAKQAVREQALPTGLEVTLRDAAWRRT